MNKSSINLRLIRDLLKIFYAHPVASLKQLHPRNVRRLISASRRHNPSTVLALARNTIQLKSQRSDFGRTDRKNSPGWKKAKELEACYPGITEPVGFSSIHVLEEKLAPPAYQIDPTAPARVNILLPQLDPLIMFGGYIACLQFIRRVQESGFHVRILLCESGAFDHAAVDKKLASNPSLQRAVTASEIENMTLQDHTVVISPADAFVCYSFWTGIKAHHLAQAIGKEFIFFLQEYEAIFHPHDSFFAIAKHVYDLPHRAIFNTSLLADYFHSKQLGVFARHEEGDLGQHCVAFQHALTPTAPPSLDELERRKTKRLLFYARPEAHARRNLFEIALIGLKKAVWQNIFDEEWEFYGVGTLGPEYDIDLGHGRTLQLRGTLPQSDYGTALREYDLGLSLMMAPHPSIMPFEMASAGQVVVTNTFGSRTDSVLRSISSNIEPCEADPESVASGLAAAVARVGAAAERIKGSELDWVMDWDDSFNDEVMERISEMLRA